MKRRIAVLLLALCLLPALSGCESLLERDYRSVSRHISQTSDTEDTSALRAESYSDLVNSVQFYVSMGETEGVVHLYQYSGDVEQDVEDACQEVLEQDPLGAWALEDITWTSSRIVSYYECVFTFTYRHTVSEIASIQSVVGFTAIRDALCDVLSDYDSSLVLQVSSYYAQKELLLGLVQEAYYSLPGYAQGYPDVSISVYPQETTGTQQIVEISFTWSDSQETLQARAEAIASAAATLVGTDPAQGEAGYWLLYSRLADGLSYSADSGRASVYTALVIGRTNSEGAALAFQYLCDQAGLTCLTVQGTLDGSPHWWNLVSVDEVWRHVDVTSGDGQEDFLRSDSQVSARYTWNTETYPACPDPETEENVSDGEDASENSGDEDVSSEAEEDVPTEDVSAE
ncbi:MAG: hypothetical protein LIO45_05530 [Clostridiales bacterium]|nr:hypothetical protein [Clostridiales bacterium]